MNQSAIVQKLWNYCNVLRDDGMSYGDYPSASLRAGSEQLTFALTLALSQRERGLNGVMADERTKAPYNQKSPVPEKYSWPSPAPTLALPRKRGRGIFCGDELFDHYRADQGG